MKLNVLNRSICQRNTLNITTIQHALNSELVKGTRGILTKRSTAWTSWAAHESLTFSDKQINSVYNHPLLQYTQKLLTHTICQLSDRVTWDTLTFSMGGLNQFWLVGWLAGVKVVENDKP